MIMIMTGRASGP